MFAYQDILWFDVPVRNGVAVNIRNSFTNFGKNKRSLMFGKPPLHNNLLEQFLALKKLSNNKPMPLIFIILINFQHIRMIQFLQYL